jgi:hypothetical protein
MKLRELVFLSSLVPLLHEQCQAQNLMGENLQHRKIVWRLSHSVGVRSSLRRLFRRGFGRRSPAAPLGEASAYEPGTWVRVRDAAAIRAMLDPADSLRGLVFTPQQWHFCGGLFRVRQTVRRIVDDQGRMRPVWRTVVLEGSTCAGVDGRQGCGRHCPLLFRDEWLEPARTPALPAPQAFDGPAGGFNAALGGVTWARVRPLEEIQATLDDQGRLDGLLFMPEMGTHAGTRARVERRIASVFELGRETPVRKPVYMLAGLSCSGQAMGDRGPCHRGCGLLWHGRWLDLEEGPGC